LRAVEHAARVADDAQVLQLALVQAGGVVVGVVTAAHAVGVAVVSSPV
jgi:hypothetical protein